DDAATGNVATWSDASAGGHNATAAGSLQPTGVAAVLNGHKVVRFNGANALTVSLASTKPYTMFAVLKKRTAGVAAWTYS
ncbi:hypothetical protein, partial [Streptococcus pneumoniae]|uniref:hypothetical protein n=1 Tax=Streptococcus pneumoniae TaxID=1313 RepID=UPI001E5A2B04